MATPPVLSQPSRKPPTRAAPAPVPAPRAGASGGTATSGRATWKPTKARITTARARRPISGDTPPSTTVPSRTPTMRSPSDHGANGGTSRRASRRTWRRCSHRSGRGGREGREREAGDPEAAPADEHAESRSEPQHPRPRSILQEAAEELAGRSDRQLVLELDDPGHLVARQPLLAEGHQVGLAHPPAVLLLEDDTGLDHLAPVGVRLADHGDEPHRRVAVEHFLHLARPDLEARGVDLILS